jgi:microcystin-dependent protein
MQNIDKFWSFTEGGIFKSWEKTDKYRYKLFSIFGIRVLDNNVTSLTLVEKLQDISETIEEEDMPIGSVVAYAGSTGAIPTNWLLCDGASYSQTTYSSLFAVIGTYHGTTGTGLFNVPDYTGRFLRGVDINSVRDPDRASRTAMNTGGNTGNLVGSIQEDAFESHAHTVPYSNGSGGGTPYAANGNAVFSSYASGSAGGNETRPVNAYVHYIIRAN